MKKHIDLYVNSYSVELGCDGRAAVSAFLRQGKDRGVLPEGREDFLLQ